MIEDMNHTNPEEDDGDEAPPDLTHRPTFRNKPKENHYRNNATRYTEEAYNKIKEALSLIWRAWTWIGTRETSFWTGWATVLICFTTIIYTYYARKQWSTMERQLQYSEDAQGAQLVIEDFEGDASPTGANKSIIKYTITNVGSTIAKDIVVQGNSVNWFVTNDGLISAKDVNRITSSIKPINSSPNGFSLGPGKSRVYTREFAVIDQVLENRTAHSFTVLVGYKDIFGREEWTGDCIFLVYLRREYLPCQPSLPGSK